MRRLVALSMVWLLLMAPLAEAAGRVLVVASANQFAQSFQAENMSERTALGVLNSLGVDYDFIRAGAARTEYCRIGVRTLGGPGGTATRTYVAVIHLDFRVAINPVTSGYRPDSLTLCTSAGCPGWPQVPQLFAGVTGTPGTTWTDNTASCSTGVASNAAGIVGAHRWYAQYLVGHTEVWLPTGFTPMARNTAAPVGGIFRPIVVNGRSSAMHANALPTATSGCNPCDSVGRSDFPDSGMVLWARYRSASDWNRPLIFCDYAGHFANSADPMLFEMAVAMLDSATGGQVIQRTVKQSLAVDGTYRTSNYNISDAGIADTLAPGIYCANDSCDDVFQTVDSLNTLRDWRGWSVPITFTVEAESLALASMDLHKRIIRRVNDHRVAISSYAGTVAAAGQGRASWLLPRDIFGHTRQRYVLPGGISTLPCGCCTDAPTDGSDSTIYCMLVRAKARADSVYRDRLSSVLMPARADWTPQSATAANSASLDTLIYAMVSLGFKGAVVSVLSNENNVGRALGPYALGWVQQGTFTARKPGTNDPPIGTFKMLPTRGSDGYRAAQNHITDASNHDVIQEETLGLLTGDWYAPHDAWHGNHMFDARTQVVRMNATALGGAGKLPGAFTLRPAWYHFKWTVNRANAVNFLAGRTVHELVTLDVLAATP